MSQVLLFTAYFSSVGTLSSAHQCRVHDNDIHSMAMAPHP